MCYPAIWCLKAFKIARSIKGDISGKFKFAWSELAVMRFTGDVETHVRVTKVNDLMREQYKDAAAKTRSSRHVYALYCCSVSRVGLE